jgi:hypothetical protein
MVANLDVAWLTSSPVVRLAAVPSGRGGPAGVFALKYRGDSRWMYLGRAKLAAGEGKKTNLNQADGVTGRLVGVLRQPPARVQRALADNFPADWQQAVGDDDQKRTSWLLGQYGYCQWTETASGPQAEDLFAPPWPILWPPDRRPSPTSTSYVGSHHARLRPLVVRHRVTGHRPVSRRRWTPGAIHRSVSVVATIPANAGAEGRH